MASKDKITFEVLSALHEQKRLLRLEYEAEKADYAEMTERVGLKRLAERGDAWFPVSHKATYFNSLNQKIIEVVRRKPSVESDDDDHNFEYGNSVSLVAVTPKESMRLLTGTVSFVDDERMAIAVADSAALAEIKGCQYAVAMALDETTHRAMAEALDAVIDARGRLGELRNLIYSRRPAAESVLPFMRFPYLNRSQEQGVNKVLRAKDVAILHGPPGTGKTTTMVEAIYETLRREPQVLVCAQSNMAVDWIAEKLHDRGVNVLRIGNPSKVTDKMLSFTYERRFESHPDYPDLWKLRKTIRELRSDPTRRRSQKKKIAELSYRISETELRIRNDIFSEVNVIASTLAGSGNRLLDGMKFSTLFIDEAAQALQAACWIAIRHASRVVLAGDHCQLPPTVKCFEAQKQGLAVSLMEQIAENHPEAVTMLSIQYRMNDDIMRFSSRYFYGNSMKSAPHVGTRRIFDDDPAIEWVDTSALPRPDDDTAADLSYREAEEAGGGRVNPDEAMTTLAALRIYISQIGERRFRNERIDIGLISPYRAQVRYLRQLIRRVPFFRPFRRHISINTVDGFQGQERDVIVISMVRSNDRGNIGFLRDLRRMNVAMTRARMKLIIIGDAPTLSAHPFYRRLHSYVRRLTTKAAPAAVPPAGIDLPARQ